MKKQNSLLYELRTVNQQVKRVLDEKTREYSDPETTGLHILTLHYLVNNSHRDIYQKDIAQNFSIRNSTATSQIKLMEKNGLIRRESVDSDARLKKIVITPKGEALELKVRRTLSDLDEMLEENLTKEELDIFYSIIDKLKQSLKQGGTL